MDKLARLVAKLSASASRPRSPSQTRRHARRSSALRDGYQLLTYAGNTPVWKCVQRDAPRPVRGSRETWTAVVSGGDQLQQLSQPLYVMDQHTKISFLVDLCVYPRFRLREHRTQTSKVVRIKWHYRTYLRLHNPAFRFGPTKVVFMTFRPRDRNGSHHRLGHSLLLQLTRRNKTPAPHRWHH